MEIYLANVKLQMALMEACKLAPQKVLRDIAEPELDVILVEERVRYLKIIVTQSKNHPILF